jgi:hypothetical protein
MTGGLSSYGGILGKQGKVILEGPRKALQDRVSLVGGRERWAADDAGLGIAPHTRHQQVWPWIGLPVGAPVTVVNQFRVAVQEQGEVASQERCKWLGAQAPG